MTKGSAAGKASSAPRSAGRKRSMESRDAILDATLRALNSVGYHNLTIEGVAADSGVGKATVYRWWNSKGALVAEAVSSRLRVSAPVPTGDTRHDLIHALEDTIANYTHVGDGAEIPALVSHLARDPALLESFRETFFEQRRSSVAKLVSRGKDEGIVANWVDVDLIFDMWAGAILYRALLRHAPADSSLAEALVDFVSPKVH